MHAPQLILFDIDGTLLHVHGVGRASFIAALRDAFAIDDDLHDVSFAGATDLGVLDQLRQRLPIPSDDASLQRFFVALAHCLEQLLQRQPAQACVGAIDVVRELHQQGHLLGIVTGNAAGTARIKLRSAGFDDAWFAVGAFGDDHADRNQLAARAKHQCTHAVRGCVLAGDTPSDVRAALHIGATAIGVTTGSCDADVLQHAGAHVVAPSLRDALRSLPWWRAPSAPRAAPGTTTLSADELDQALTCLEQVADDASLLAGMSAQQRIRWQRAAGMLARPDLKQRKLLQRTLLREEKRAKDVRDEELRKETGIRQLRNAPVFAAALPHPTAPPPEPATPTSDEAERGHQRNQEALHEPRICYVCKAPYRMLHRFYDQLCPACGDVNEAKRQPQVSLQGRVALVTGARVKIGYHAALMLLRCGAEVIVTTRFPHDAVRRLQQETDFASFASRVHVYGLDLRHTPSVERFAAHLLEHSHRLDFVIHNACQTVRRPPSYFAHRMDEERRSDVRHSEPMLQRYHHLTSSGDARGLQQPAELTQLTASMQVGLAATLGAHADAANASAVLDALFPRGQSDADEQQIDLRTHNSWRMGLGEVPAIELLEVLLINAVAPFVLTARLLPLLQHACQGDRHVVNVSAMEGQFYRAKKTTKHPHTNMAKAALNMMVRTSAPELAALGIHLNAVDTGWITDEDPAHITDHKASVHRFSPPLDVVDGAARIVDPIVVGVGTGTHASGLFYKDYKPTAW
jgi:NAD(P)-dependent dehydrogenase (short-subunit alcohol dehydrogenase family)/phosphoglycolate phosphatase-like HAD superfamily hydrolase